MNDSSSIPNNNDNVDVNSTEYNLVVKLKNIMLPIDAVVYLGIHGDWWSIHCSPTQLEPACQHKLKNRMGHDKDKFRNKTWVNSFRKKIFEKVAQDMEYMSSISFGIH